MLIHTQMRHIRIMSDFMLATRKAKKAWNDTLSPNHKELKNMIPNKLFLDISR